MLTIYIDNKPYQVKEGQNLLNACLSLGFDLPYFCWHPAMHSVGACRQCAVKMFKDEKDTRGRIVMSCMTPAAEGLRLSIDDPEARAFRSSVIEWLMLNHPHDCPVCDEGGECHLQDMTVMTGHNYRRTRFRKRTHRNQDLGPFVNHEMNRCIACYRCVRFYRDYAGGRDFGAFASHDNVYFGRHEEGALESEFSGNLVEVCPTGVFTDKSLKRRYTRKWDLQTAPSVCIHCGLGCNTIPGERYGTLRRVLNRFNGEVNGYFLCDRGRFGYEFVNSGKRIRKPLLKVPSPTPPIEGGATPGRANSTHHPTTAEEVVPPLVGGIREGVRPVSKETALKHIKDMLGKGKSIIGIGSPRASLESNFALRTLVGPERFYSGMSPNEHRLVTLVIDILQKGPARTPSLHEVEMADAVLILGEDLTNTAPLLDLAIRQSVRNKPNELTATIRIPGWDDNAMRSALQDETGPLFIASITNTKLDELATKTFHAAPDDLARLGFAIACELDPKAPIVPDLRDEHHKLAREIAEALKKAKRPLIISGPSLGSETVIQAAANIAWSLCKSGRPAELCFTVPECNSIGAGLMDGRNPGELFHPSPTLRDEGLDTVIILENDLYRRADKDSVDAFLGRAKNIIVIDHLVHPTSVRADIALPAGTFAESDGTLVNNEGRGQRFYQVFVPSHDIQDSWQWINDILKAVGKPAVDGLQSFDGLINEMASILPVFAPVKDIAPSADFRISGQKIPRQPHRYSGRTAMLADIDIHEPKPADDPDSPLSFSMEGRESPPPAPLISRYWSPGWNSVQALNKFQQEVGGPLRGGDPGKRLIEPLKINAVPFYATVPGAFKPKKSEWLIVPLQHIFGSGELSMLSPGIALRAPGPYLALGPGDAGRLQVAEGDTVELSIADVKYRVRAKIAPEIPEGTAALYSNQSEMPVHSLPLYSTIGKTE